MKRIVVTGPAGAGKSELARRLGDRLELPVLHLDTMFWRPGWVATPPDEWEQLQRREAEAEAWVAEGQFDDIADVWVQSADAVVFVDVSPLRCLWRVTRRRFDRDAGVGVPSGTEPAPFHRAFLKFLRNQWRYRRRVRPQLLAELARPREGRRTVTLRGGDDGREFLAGVDSPR